MAPTSSRKSRATHGLVASCSLSAGHTRIARQEDNTRSARTDCMRNVSTKHISMSDVSLKLRRCTECQQLGDDGSRGRHRRVDALGDEPHGDEDDDHVEQPAKRRPKLPNPSRTRERKNDVKTMGWFKRPSKNQRLSLRWLSKTRQTTQHRHENFITIRPTEHLALPVP